jgi:adenosylcobyric acid synthase
MTARARVLMVQGTASSVGKSLLVAGLCRLFRQQGLRVAPFKAQNMSNNAAVTPDGGEIGRAQAVQAEAAGVDPTVDMNPILLKPEADHRSQVVVRGRAVFTLKAGDFLRRKPELWPVVAESLDRLRAAYDLVLIEGAGSPAEINLKAGDIVNMRVARHAEAPVLLAGDIDRGGVFAHLYGTVALLEPEERRLVRGFVINKFRGDVSLLRPGLAMIEERAGVPVVGVVPYVRDLRIADEDAVALEQPRPRGAGAIDVAVVRLPHIANFDDIDPLEREPDVRVRYVAAAADFGTPDLVILPGSKTTIPDLEWLHRTGLADAVRAHAAAGGAVLGLCGGYQMLGREVCDPLRVESDRVRLDGLALLPMTTTLTGDKATHRVEGTVLADRGLFAGATGAEARGYEIHMGRSEAAAEPVLRLARRSGQDCDVADGAASVDGWVAGVYVHGLLENDRLRAALLANVAARRGLPFTPAVPLDREAEYDRLAAVLRDALDVAAVERIAGL